MARAAGPGRIEAIFVRPARKEPPVSVQSVEASAAGLTGDHAREGMRAVTLIQAEHLPVIAALAHLDSVTAEDLRRNIVVSGLNLLAFRKHRLQLGDVVLDITGPCPPCSRMETVLGFGGYNAMRGHGGVYAAVEQGGMLSIGDAVTNLPSG
ncbi:MAG: MOSC domain-containing protein [Silicimonas sp.]|nr:MOSC domain-containing protein [Silicimonas sp.]